MFYKARVVAVDVPDGASSSVACSGKPFSGLYTNHEQGHFCKYNIISNIRKPILLCTSISTGAKQG